MCGLYGMVGPGVIKADLEMLRDLAWVSGLRGHDGSGLIQGRAYKTHRKLMTAKSEDDISYFLRYHKYHKDGNKKLFNDIGDNLFIGHVRAATLGEINDENAHPFEFKTLIGCHNGTLWDKKYQHDTKTDSELLFKDMDERGIIPVLEELNVNSAYAITLFNKYTHTINIVRNDKRDLFYALNANRSVMYWASELEMLKLCAKRREIKIENYYYFRPHVLYTFTPNDVNLRRSPDWKRTTFQLKETKVVEKDKKDDVPFEADDKTLRLPIVRAARKDERKGFGRLENIEDISNIIPLKPRKSNQVSRFRRHCKYCSEEMTLVDQYFGSEEITPNNQIKWVCAPCTDLKKATDKNVVNTVH